MDQLRQDIKYAFRSLRQAPGVFAVAALSLALGVAVNVTLFAGVDILLLRPLDYPNHARLVQVWSDNRERGWDQSSVSLPDFVDWRKESGSLSLAAYGGGSYNMAEGDRPERVSGPRVSPSFFSLLGYPALPDSPAPWVVTCLQVVPETPDRAAAASALLTAVCEELDRRGIIAVEAYPEGVDDPWSLSPGPASVYEAVGFARAAGEERYPVYRRELEGSSADVGWGDLLSHTRPPDEGEEWPLPLPKGPSEEDLFRLPPKTSRPNPFGDD